MNNIYLKGVVGAALSECLSELVTSVPNDPIEWIALWLYRYRDHEHYFHEKSLFNRDLRMVKLTMQKEQNDRDALKDCANEEIEGIKEKLATNHVIMVNLRKTLGTKYSGTKKAGFAKKIEIGSKQHHPHHGQKQASRSAFTSSSRMTMMMNRVSTFHTSQRRTQIHHHHHQHKKKEGKRTASEASENVSSDSEQEQTAHVPVPPMPKMSLLLPQLPQLAQQRLSQQLPQPLDPPPAGPEPQMNQQTILAQLSKIGAPNQKSRAPKRQKTSGKQSQPSDMPTTLDQEPLPIEVPFSDENAEYVSRQTFPDPTPKNKRSDFVNNKEKEMEGTSELDQIAKTKKSIEVLKTKSGHVKNREAEEEGASVHRKDRSTFDGKEETKRHHVDEDHKGHSIITVKDWLEDAASSLGLSASDVESNFYERHPELQHMSQRTSKRSSDKSSVRMNVDDPSSHHAHSYGHKSTEREEVFTPLSGESSEEVIVDHIHRTSKQTSDKTSGITSPGVSGMVEIESPMVSEKASSGMSGMVEIESPIVAEKASSGMSGRTSPKMAERTLPKTHAKIHKGDHHSHRSTHHHGHKSMELTEKKSTPIPEPKHKHNEPSQKSVIDKPLEIETAPVDSKEAESKHHQSKYESDQQISGQSDSMAEEENESKVYFEDEYSGSETVRISTKAPQEEHDKKHKQAQKVDHKIKSRDTGSKAETLKATWCLDCNLGLVCDHPILGQMRARCPFVMPETPAWWEQIGYLAQTLYDPEIYSVGFECLWPTIKQ